MSEALNKNHYFLSSVLLPVFNGYFFVWKRHTVSGIMSLPCLKSFDIFPINYAITKDTQIEEINAVYTARAARAPDLIPLLYPNCALQLLVHSISYLLSVEYIPLLVKWPDISSIICKPKIPTEKHFLINLLSHYFYLVLLFARLHGLLLC